MFQNKIIISTRPAGAPDQIGGALTALGATVLDMPLIEIVPINITQEILLGIFINKTYNWLIFSSKNSVEILFDQAKEFLTDNTLPFKTAVFGERTAISLRKLGFEPDLINDQNTSADLLRDLIPKIEQGDRLLLAAGNLATDLIEETITPIARIDRVDVYRTIFVKSVDGEILRRIPENRYDLILFTSPSGFKSFIHHTNGEIDLNGLKIACIGPSTHSAILAQYFSYLSSGELIDCKSVY